jgi:hypothetical protein
MIQKCPKIGGGRRGVDTPGELLIEEGVAGSRRLRLQQMQVYGKNGLFDQRNACTYLRRFLQVFLVRSVISVARMGRPKSPGV